MLWGVLWDKKEIASWKVAYGKVLGILIRRVQDCGPKDFLYLRAKHNNKDRTPRSGGNTVMYLTYCIERTAASFAKQHTCEFKSPIQSYVKLSRHKHRQAVNSLTASQMQNSHFPVITGWQRSPSFLSRHPRNVPDVIW